MGDVFPPPAELTPDASGLVALGGRLTPELLIEAYSKGIFPWSDEPPIPWFSPDPRLILEPDDFVLSRSMRKVLRRGGFTVRFDHDFLGVMKACAAAPREGQDGTWIGPRMYRAYGELHARGIAHSAETYVDDRLVGGLYGLCLGRTFFGESMFSHRTNASKIALFALTRRLVDLDFDLIDCQQETPHLISLGAHSISRAEFLERLEASLQHESPHYRWEDPTQDELTPD